MIRFRFQIKRCIFEMSMHQWQYSIPMTVIYLCSTGMSLDDTTIARWTIIALFSHGILIFCRTYSTYHSIYTFYFTILSSKTSISFFFTLYAIVILHFEWIFHCVMTLVLNKTKSSYCVWLKMTKKIIEAEENPRRAIQRINKNNKRWQVNLWLNDA